MVDVERNKFIVAIQDPDVYNENINPDHGIVF